MGNRVLGLLWVLLIVTAVAVPSAGEAPPRNTITVTGEATLQIVPNRATITLGVVTQQTTASEAMREVSRITRRILDEVERLGIPRDQVQTSIVGIAPVHSQAERVPVIVGYRAEYILTVTVDDIDLVGKLIDAAVRAGANVLRGVSFGLRAEEVHRLRALQAAVHNARQRAEALAKAAGISSPLRVVRITESSAVTVPQLQASALMRTAEAVPVEPGLVTVRATVTVVFEF